MEIINDFSTSVKKALEEIDPKYEGFKGLVVCGTHSPKTEQVETALKKIREARESGTPFLGICFGLQLAVIEFSRNVLGIPDATSEELGAGTYVVEKMTTMRVGAYPVNGRLESHWHNYKVAEGFWGVLNQKFAILVQDGVVEEMKLFQHPFFFACQYHPEYQSSKNAPHPTLKEFLNACK